MTFSQKDPFVSMLIHAFIGAFIVSLGGLIMVFFIGLVNMVITQSAQSLAEMIEEGFVWPAMSMGAIVGTILGGVAGLRKTRS